MITINAESRKKIAVELVGVKYEVTPPKMALSLAFAKVAQNAQKDPLAMLQLLEDWIKVAFGSKGASVLKRLDNPKDDLDIAHITDLIEKISEAQTENPTM